MSSNPFSAVIHTDLISLATDAGYLAAVLGVCMVVPQIVRIYRNRALPGVSWMSWALTALSCLTWGLYGLRSAEIPQIPGNALAVAGAVVIVVSVPATISRRTRILALLVAALALVGLAGMLPPTAVGFVAFGIGLVSTLPQTVRSITGSGDGPSAVSVPTWIIYAISQACWLGYAIVLHDPVVVIASTFVVTTSLVVAVAELRHRPARAVADPAEPSDQLQLSLATL